MAAHNLDLDNSDEERFKREIQETTGKTFILLRRKKMFVWVR